MAHDRWALLASARYEIITLGPMGHYSLTTTIKKRCERNNQINGPVSLCMRRKRTIICNYIIFMFHHLGWIKRLLKKFNLQFFFPVLRNLSRASRISHHTISPSRGCFDIWSVILPTFLYMLSLFFHFNYFAVLCYCCYHLSAHEYLLNYY